MHIKLHYFPSRCSYYDYFAATITSIISSLQITSERERERNDKHAVMTHFVKIPPPPPPHTHIRTHTQTQKPNKVYTIVAQAQTFILKSTYKTRVTFCQGTYRCTSTYTTSQMQDIMGVNPCSQSQITEERERE